VLIFISLIASSIVDERFSKLHGSTSLSAQVEAY